MLLVTLVYASLMLIGIGGSALASSGHRINELMHVRDDGAQRTLPAVQHLSLLQSISAEVGKSVTGLRSPSGDSQSLHAVPIERATQVAHATWVAFVTTEAVRIADRPVKRSPQGAVLALLQRHHRAVVLHL